MPRSGLMMRRRKREKPVSRLATTLRNITIYHLPLVSQEGGQIKCRSCSCSLPCDSDSPSILQAFCEKSILWLENFSDVLFSIFFCVSHLTLCLLSSVVTYSEHTSYLKRHQNSLWHPVWKEWYSFLVWYMDWKWVWHFPNVNMASDMLLINKPSCSILNSSLQRRFKDQSK